LIFNQLNGGPTDDEIAALRTPPTVIMSPPRKVLSAGFWQIGQLSIGLSLTLLRPNQCARARPVIGRKFVADLQAVIR
jgi:hypothetical protein